jgi:hypothetical protein
MTAAVATAATTTAPAAVAIAAATAPLTCRDVERRQRQAGDDERHQQLGSAVKLDSHECWSSR